MERPCAFVSFSTKDDHDYKFVSYLLTRLKAHALEAWIFQEEGTEIPFGEDIPTVLRERIDGCRMA